MRNATLVVVLVASAVAGAQPAFAQAGGDAVLSTQTLLVVAAILSASLLVIAGFSLWQSHRFYLETVNLHRDLTAAHQALLDRVLILLRDGRGGPSRTGSRPPASASEQPVAPAQESPRPSPPPPAPVVLPAEPAGRRTLTGLSDVEYAVLEKLAQDPAFFELHPLESFGASRLTVSALMHRGLVRLDGLGRHAVPDEVQAALRARFPRN